MKNAKEIASAVFVARDEYMEQQQLKNRRIKKAAAISATACVLCLTVVGAGCWHSYQGTLPVLDMNTEVIESITETSIVEESNDNRTHINPSNSADEYSKGNASMNSASSQSNEASDQFNENRNDLHGVTNDNDVQPTPENNTDSTVHTSSSNNNRENDICHYMKHVIVNGEAYVEYHAGTEIYTPDICLGSPSDYDGNYRAFFSHIPATLYTTKENPEVLIVDESGEIVHLIKVKQ